MNKQKYPLAKVYTLLGSGPVVLITSSLKGKPNIMPIAWHTTIDFEPPIVGCCIGDHSYIFQVAKKTKTPHRISGDRFILGGKEISA